jgi:hypothetical protein
MIDERTRCSLLHMVERSITAQWLLAELESVFAAAAGTPKVLRMDTGLSFSTAATVCASKVELSYIPPNPNEQRVCQSFNNRMRTKCLNRNDWNTPSEARVVIGDFRHEHNDRTAVRPWAAERPLGASRRAGIPTPACPARSGSSSRTCPALAPRSIISATPLLR